MGDETVLSPSIDCQALLETSPHAKVLASRNGCIVSVNSQALTAFGYSREDLLGKPVEGLFSTRLRQEYARLREKVLAGSSLQPEGTVAHQFALRKNGQEFPVEVWLGLFKASERQYVVYTISDLSNRIKLEEQLRQAQKMESIGRLTGGIAHDFNNLLTIILGHGGLLLKNRDVPESVRGEIELVYKTAERAATLTKQLLQFSRQQVLQPKNLDINSAVRDISALLQRLIGEDIILLQNISSVPAWGKLDPVQFQQVILNLAVNARDAMPNGGKLTIETSLVKLDDEYAQKHTGVSAGSYVMLAVSDTGVGMDARTRARIFEPFFTTKDAGKGTGLGLATVYGIVVQSGGHIWVYSEPGHGTTFKIYFPQVNAKELTEESPVVIRDSIKPFASTIMVVEDERFIGDLLEKILHAGGFNVIRASNGEEALALAGKHSGGIALLLTDVVMPRMGGRQLAEKMQALLPDLKVLYMSGYTHNAVVHHGVLDAGLSFIEKPFSPEAVLKKVYEMLHLVP